MKISRRVEALEHGVQPGELQHLFQNYDQIVIIEFQRYQKEPCTETSTLSTQFKSIYIYSTLYLYMQKVHMYVLCISFDSPGARGCPRGKWKTHGGVVKTEYLQDPKGRNLKTWSHHMDDTLVIGSWKGTFVNILCLQPCAESNILNRGSCEASAGHCHQPRWDGHIADRDRWGRSNMKAVPTYILSSRAGCDPAWWPGEWSCISSGNQKDCEVNFPGPPLVFFSSMSVCLNYTLWDKVGST